MSKKPITLSALEAEACAQFLLILRLLHLSGGRFGKLKISPATDGHDDTKRVRIATTYKTIRDEHIEGEVVLKAREGEEWRLYCAASYILLGDEMQVDFSFDYDEQVYDIKKRYANGGLKPMTVNMVTGERKVFADPADCEL